MTVAGFFWGNWAAADNDLGCKPCQPFPQATALALRFTGNRLGQVFGPFLAWAVAGVGGTSTIFLITGSLLADAGYRLFGQ